ncbi:MAG: threonylcarbamoyl-AMP synthase [Flavobacteriales bacterium]|nr:threonylcarbamoyl-AMP synthase [Flavobacteriales bacterium]
MAAVIGTDLKEAARLLSAGELVAVPTETVYGLAANAFDEAAVLKVFEAKQRPAFDPLIVHVHSMEQLASVVREMPPEAETLMQAFWPGPLTLVLPKHPSIPDLVTSGLDTVGVRMPAHPLTLQLLSALPFPLAAPSANPFGYVSPTTAQHVADQLGDRIPYILDGGACAVGVESTIIGWEEQEPASASERNSASIDPQGASLDSQDPERSRGASAFSASSAVTFRRQGHWVLYRAGGVPVEAIEKVIGIVRPQVKHVLPVAPGMLESHYAPRKPVFIGDITELLKEHSGRAAVISFTTKHQAWRCEVLSPSGDLNEAARHLFATLRALDASEADVILAEVFPDEGLGRAINDRLKRAAAKR